MDTGPARNASFGTELRRLRGGAGLSLTDLAALVHYSRSHLSKVETGAKAPSTDLARRCDATLGCDGALAALAPTPSAGRVRSGGGPDHGAADHNAADHNAADYGGEVWIVSMGGDAETGFGTVSRRHLLAGAVTGLAVPDPRGRRPAERGAGAQAAAGTHQETIASFQMMFGEMRGLGQKLAPKALISVLAAHTHVLRSMAGQARPAERDAALRLAGRYAEYTGWMAQEAGDDVHAMWWTDRAVEFAAAGGDEEMAAYAMVRRGLVALYRHDAATTVALAEGALSRARTARVRGLAAQRAAQGHALAGDYEACFRALDVAAELLSQTDGSGGPVIGTANVPDPVAMTTGWCWFDLGQPARAAAALGRELDRIPLGAERARSRYAARLALSLAGAGEPEQACAVAAPVLDACERLDSATVRSDLCGLSRALNRWHALPAVQDTRIRLLSVLQTTG
ncbi:helix-turn-helix domain-containing protein [Catenulispora rubra]|uniref:helix-turn-helix domain-containing protein n=1 Tax=Catenulispora rubra TaxID=280293 RepID=UPI0018925CCC|nr:helix-turn-helix transcriptional regulator [Catenulispora rubra]